MDRVKIQEIADEAGASNAVLIEKAKELGYDVKVASSTVTVEQAGILVDYVINGVKPKVEKPKPKVLRKADVVKKAEVEEVAKEEAPKTEENLKVEKVVETTETKEETPVEKKKTVPKRKTRMGSITATPKKKKVEIIEVVKVEETLTEASTSTDEKVIEATTEVEVTENKVEELAKDETTDKTATEASTTEEVVKVEEPVIEKPKQDVNVLVLPLLKKQTEINQESELLMSVYLLLMTRKINQKVCQLLLLRRRLKK